MKIALVSCSKSKKNYPCAASEMYQPSQLFSLSYDYAKQHADRVFILSSRYGLLEPDQQIVPYEATLKELSEEAFRRWNQGVISKLKLLADPERDEFIILAGKDYYRGFQSHLKQVSLPLGRKPINERITWLQNNANHEKADAILHARDKSNPMRSDQSDFMAERLHQLFHNERHYRGSELREIPFENGVYVVYEQGETYHHLQRIVRVGTHTSQGRLKARLLDHFAVENKDGSIFRKNVGKAILNKARDPFLKDWMLDTSKLMEHPHLDRAKQREVERKVSHYINKFMDVAVFPVEDPAMRLRLEEGIIAVLNQTQEFAPGSGWLGNFSPDAEIRRSGLWLKKGLNGIPLRQSEFHFIQRTLGYKIETEAVDWAKTTQTEISDRPTDPTVKMQTEAKITTGNIRAYINRTLQKCQDQGMEQCILKSGDIHEAMALSSRMPMVCSAMYGVMEPGDQVLSTTPSGFSSTIQIKYVLKGRFLKE